MSFKLKSAPVSEVLSGPPEVIQENQGTSKEGTGASHPKAQKEFIILGNDGVVKGVSGTAIGNSDCTLALINGGFRSVSVSGVICACFRVNFYVVHTPRLHGAGSSDPEGF